MAQGAYTKVDTREFQV